VTRRAVVDVVRVATLGSYGVTGFAGGWIGRLTEWLGLDQPGIQVTFGPEAGRSKVLRRPAHTRRFTRNGEMRRPHQHGVMRRNMLHGSN